MRNTRRGLLFAAVVLPLALSACAGTSNRPRIELPQQFRLPQANLVTLFERRSGRIAVIDETGNLVIMDQTGGAAVKITRDAVVDASTVPTGSVSNGLTNTYHWPVWSPDASHIAFVEVMAQQPAASRIIELGAEAVMVQHGPGSLTIEQTSDGRTIQVPVTDTASIIQQPSRVIIEQGGGAGTIVSSAIYTARIDGKSPLQEVYESNQWAIGYLNWSPDNAQLAFLGQTGDQEASLELVNAANGKPRILASGVSATWSWHPDGKTLVAKVETSLTGSTADLGLWDAQKDQSIATIARQADLSFGAPAFSPDGNAILLTATSGGQDYLALADNRGNIKRNLVPVNGMVQFSWSPVDAKVAYIVQQAAGSASSSQNGGALHLLDVNSGQDKLLSQMPVSAFFWSPDGQRLATFSPLQVNQMSKDFPGIDLTDRQPASILMLQTIDTATGAYRQLFYLEPSTDFARLLSQFDRFSRAMNIWSPDSRSLVFSVTFDNGQGSTDYVVETEATGSVEPRVISQGSLAVWSPR
ncbi:MAG: hypothetical protein M1434_06435 [Chloroflexi bacterium]|nr:hypothetical protein [Chloroflexota bacterium]MCL5274371.1 hypothetical protein [Chloroflexota bacterium]